MTTIRFTRDANFRVLADSSNEAEVGLMVQITITLAWPDNAGCNILVNFESRKGTWPGKLNDNIIQWIDDDQLQILSFFFAFGKGREKEQMFLYSYFLDSVSFAMTVPRVSKLNKQENVCIS